jgi:squalene cyclase
MEQKVTARFERARIPKRLAPYFQEYRLEKLNLERDANLIIQRTLEFGTWDDIRWLFRMYGAQRIKRFLSELGERGLSRVAFNYWRRLLRVKRWRKSPFAASPLEVWPFS